MREGGGTKSILSGMGGGDLCSLILRVASKKITRNDRKESNVVRNGCTKKHDQDFIGEVKSGVVPTALPYHLSDFVCPPGVDYQRKRKEKQPQPIRQVQSACLSPLVGESVPSS